MATGQGLPQVVFKDGLSEPDFGLEREWLVSNGIGGYASASLVGANTRVYHGLLVAALQPPLGRTVLLGRLDEVIEVGERRYYLDVNEWSEGGMSSTGLKYLQSVTLLGTLPHFEYAIGRGTFSKIVWTEYGLNTTYVRYRYDAPEGSNPISLQVRPLVNTRDYHGHTEGNENIHFLTTAESTQSWQIRAEPENSPKWRLSVFDQTAEWQPLRDSGWYWGYFYRQEARRGLVATEDMYCVGTWEIMLAPGQSVTFVASTEPDATVAALYPQAYERELDRQQALLSQAELTANPTEPLDRIKARLTLAADQFIVGRPDKNAPGRLLSDYRTVLAGYPWFGDWGRDTMIALTGLTLVTKRYAEAATILTSFARFVDKGMLPNRFPDNPSGNVKPPEGEYNTVDATLWYFVAIENYLNATGDEFLGRQLYPVLADIIQWHVQGTRFGIGVDSDGLLRAGAPLAQLTWMDAKIGDWVVTPRHGKPVEINALWYAACRIMQKLAGQYSTGDEAARYQALADQVASVFEPTFWYAAGGYLYDCINPDGSPDPSLRPNQVIALAVAPDLIALDKQAAAMEQVRQQLLTPYGLRTLNQANPAYRPKYQGDAVQRDSSYHQGTIWPWLLGSYGAVLARLGQASAVPDLLLPFQKHLDEEGIGQVSEIFEPEPPFTPVGCFAQAWSVSQLLELWQLHRSLL